MVIIDRKGKCSGNRSTYGKNPMHVFCPKFVHFLTPNEQKKSPCSQSYLTLFIVLLHVEQSLARIYADLCERYMYPLSTSINLLKNKIPESEKNNSIA